MKLTEIFLRIDSDRGARNKTFSFGKIEHRTSDVSPLVEIYTVILSNGKESLPPVLLPENLSFSVPLSSANGLVGICFTWYLSCDRSS